jgi:hypothetical protein
VASYLQRVVMSGARIQPRARPPMAVAPPLPSLSPTIPASGPADRPELPAEADTQVSAPDVAEMDTPNPAPTVTPGLPDLPVQASRPPRPALVQAGAQRDASATLPARSPLEADVVIRAPRGLRAAATTAVTSRPSEPWNTAPSPTPAGTVASPDVVTVPRPAPAVAPFTEGQPSESQPSPTLTRDRGDDGFALIELPTDVADRAIERSRPAEPDRAPAVGQRAPARAPEAWEPAPRPVPAAVSPAPGHERERRLTIGRIDVEVHNEPPPPPVPAPSPTPRADAAVHGARLASRFLLKP